MFDGSFQLDGNTINYKIIDDSLENKIVNGQEKMSRWFNYYDASGKLITTKIAYDSTDELQNITPEYAKKLYTE